MCREAIHKKHLLNTWINPNPKWSDIKGINHAVRPKVRKFGFGKTGNYQLRMKNYLNRIEFLSQYWSIPLCPTISVRIGESNLHTPWAWIPMSEKSINLLEREWTRLYLIFIAPLLNTHVFNRGVSRVESGFLNKMVFIWIYIDGIEYLRLLCEYERLTNKWLKNCIESDRFEAEKYEWIHFFILLFPT